MHKLLKIHVGPLNNDGPLLFVEQSLLFKHFAKSNYTTCEFGVHHNNKACCIPLKCENAHINQNLSPKNLWSKTPLNRFYFQTQDCTQL